MILVVDDDRDLGFLLERALSRWGYEFRIFSDPLQAVAEVRRSRYDVVLADVRMPGLDGLQFTQIVKAQSPQSEVVIMTAYASIETAAKAIRLGAFDYLLKPFGEMDLVRATLERALEKKRLEGELRASRETFASIVEKAIDGILVVDSDRVVRYANTAAQMLLSRAADALVGHSFAFELSDRESTEIRVGEVQGVPRILEFRATETSWVGSPALLVTSRDVTIQRKVERERREFEERLFQSQKLESVGLLAGGIAHDFNNLMMVVLGYADLVVGHPNLTPECRDYVARIEAAGRKAASLADQMLDYGGRRWRPPVILDLSRLVRELSQLMEVAISRKAKMQLDLQEALPPIAGDRNQIQQVVMNLISNASEALGAEPGTIRITTGSRHADRSYLSLTYVDDQLAEGTYVFLEVIDTGCGMDFMTTSRMFDPFFSTKDPGRGLGLSAALGIVRCHRGAFEIQSAPGQGTTARVLFPALLDRGVEITAPVEPVPQVATWRCHGRILIVDDEQDVRDLLENELKTMGFDVTVATDGMDAVEAFRRESGDFVLVVMDLTMPRLSGHEALRQILQIRSDARVVLMTGYSDCDVAQVRRDGFAGLLRKPYSAMTLRQTLQSLLGDR